MAHPRAKWSAPDWLATFPPAMPPPPQDPALLASLLAQVAAHRRSGSPLHDAESALAARHGCERKLAVYGTLAPGECNHDQVAALGGTWQRVAVRGRRAVRDYPVFTWDEAAAATPMLLLESALLRAAWPRLDAFEGPDYCRILVPVALPSGEWDVANLYEARTPVLVS